MCQAGGTRRGTSPPAPSPYPRMPPQLMLHTRARPTPAGTAESCGTALSVAVMVGFPCAQTPLIAHGSPTTTHHAHQESPSFQQKPAAVLQGPRSPMCNTNDNHTHQAHHIPHNQPTTNSNRNRTDLGAEYDRSRRGNVPISRRKRTDLGAELDRSRGGNGPISVRNSTDLAAETDRSREMNAVLATQQVC